MEKRLRQFNVGMFMIAALILGALVFTGFMSGHPWALTCYQCKACNLKCPLGYDVSLFVVASATNNPNLYMSATNLQLTVEEAYETDRDMLVEVDGKKMTAKEAHEELSPDMVVWARKLRVKDAAKFDPIDGYCDSLCPIGLPVTNAIRDLKSDGEFNGR